METPHIKLYVVVELRKRRQRERQRQRELKKSNELKMLAAEETSSQNKQINNMQSQMMK